MTYQPSHLGALFNEERRTEQIQHQRSEVYRTLQNLRYPPGPRLSPIEIAPDTEHPQQIINITSGEDQLLPSALLFQHDALPKVDPRLAFQERQRPVAQPTITFMPEYPDYLWGAATNQVTSRAREDGMRVHFEEITEAATNPPVSRMSIWTGIPGGWQIVEASQRERQYVAVVDIQREVIGWMKGVEQNASSKGASAGLSRWVRMTDWDGTEVEVEVWVWRGLQPLGTTMEMWELVL